jgi:flagellar motor switch protein FliM
MESVLSQQEIDAMVKAARVAGSSETPEAPRARVEPWDLRRSSQIGREQLEAITSLHEGFARNLTHALSAYLRAAFSAVLVSAEHLSYREFLQSIPESGYLASCRLEPMGLNAVLQLDLKVAFPMIELLLGGEAHGGVVNREVTEIEEQILDSVARIVCRELGSIWKPLAVELAFEGRMGTASARRLMSPEDKTLLLSFEAAVSEVRGGLNIAVPVTVSHALLRKLSSDWTSSRSRSGQDSRQRLMQLLLDCPFSAELIAPGLRLPVTALADVAPGDVLTFERPAGAPAALFVSGCEMYSALPARSGNVRAAKLLQPAPQPLSRKK